MSLPLPTLVTPPLGAVVLPGYRKGHVYNDELWGFLRSKFLGRNLEEFWEKLSVVARTGNMATQSTMIGLLTMWAYHINDPPSPFLATTNRNALSLAVANFINTGHLEELSLGERAIVQSWSQRYVESVRRQDGSTIDLYELAKKLDVRVNKQRLGLPDDLKLSLDTGIQLLQDRAGQLKPGVQPQPDGSYYPQDFYPAFDPDDMSYATIQSLALVNRVDPASWTPRQREELADMPPREAELYEKIVIPVQRQIMASYQEAKAVDRSAVRPLIVYGELKRQMIETNGGRPLSPSTNAQLAIDNDRQSIAHTIQAFRKQD